MKRITLKTVITAIGDLKKDLKGDIGFVRTEIAQVDKKIDAVKAELKKDIETLTQHVDGFAKNQLKFDAELAAGTSARDRRAGGHA